MEGKLKPLGLLFAVLGVDDKHGLFKLESSLESTVSFPERFDTKIKSDPIK